MPTPTCKLLAALALIGLPLLADAATVHVAPGAGTLQAAIDAASDGDTLLGAGTYTGPVVVHRSLEIVAEPGGAMVIDAECAAVTALTILADRVTIKGPLLVQGAAQAVFVDDSSHTTLKRVSAIEICGNAEASGIRIREGDHLKVQEGLVSGFPGAAFVLQDVAVKAKILVSKVQLLDGNLGFYLEDIAPGANPKGAGVLFKGNVVESSIAYGWTLNDVDGVVVQKNTTLAATDAAVVDGASANNIFRGNTFVAGAVDFGSGNCWKGNVGHPDACP